MGVEEELADLRQKLRKSEHKPGLGARAEAIRARIAELEAQNA